MRHRIFEADYRSECRIVMREQGGRCAGVDAESGTEWRELCQPGKHAFQRNIFAEDNSMVFIVASGVLTVVEKCG